MTRRASATSRSSSSRAPPRARSGLVTTEFLGGGLTVQGLGLDLRRLPRRDQPARDPPVRGARDLSDLLRRHLAARHRASSASPAPARTTRSERAPDIDLTWSLLSALLGLAIFTFVGVEYTCPLAEELKRPSRDIPCGDLHRARADLDPVVLYGLARDPLHPGRRARRPRADDHGRRRHRHLRRGRQVVDGARRHRSPSIGTLNAVLAGVPRILYGMALTRQLPVARSAGCSRQHALPWVGIIVIAAIPS